MNLSIEERNQMVLDNSKLIPYVIKRYMHISPFNPNYEDLMQEGYIALIKAVERFDPDKGFTFGTYAGSVIFGYLQVYCRDCLSPNGVVIPRHIQEKVIKAIKEDRNIDELTSDEKIAYRIFTSPELSFDYEYPGEEGDVKSLKDIVADEVSLKTYEELEMEMLLKSFLEYLKPLEPKHFDMIEEHIYEKLNTYKGYTLQELGDKYGITRERVRQILARVKERFRKFISK